jgi:transcription-repair coupling factor (superfamily II helicase)
MGVYEIRQNDTTLLLYVKELKSPAVADLLIAVGGKAQLNAGAKPYLTVKCPSGTGAVDMLKRISASASP